jgi:TolB-like protein/DNA-binding winged helix-turn-helix (wHTH) protein/Tfp pilus assembly protein PilF
MAVNRPTQRVSFGDFVADFDAFELRKHGIRLKLQDQPFQILKLLLQRSGHLVTREELRAQLWTDSTFVDFDAGLNAAMRRLRDALNDSADEPRYIETLPRHGYRFIARTEIATESVPNVLRDELVLAPALPNLEEGQLQVDPTFVKGDEPANQGRKFWRINSPARLAAVCVLTLAVAIGVAALRSRAIAKYPADSRIHSLAVLPLQNLSGDPSEEYFADGMTDALITDLAKIHSLRVVSRTSAMHYKDSRQPLPEIARELQVDAVVEGSVVRSGNRVRVNVQLVHAQSDRHMWAKAYERDANEILALQQNLTTNIAEEIRAKLTPDEQTRLEATRTLNPAAYEASLEGRYNWNKRSLDGFNNGLALFERAIQADPTYAPAYAGMANCYNFLGLGMGPLSPREYAHKARAAAQKALQLDENLADAHAALAFTLYHYDWNWAQAEQEFRRAVELDPRNSIIRGWFADFLSFLGQAEEARAQRLEVRDLDPFSIQAVRSIAGAYGAARQDDRAIDYYQKAIESQSDTFRMRMDLGGDYLRAQRFQDAAEQFQKVLTLYGPNVYPLARLAYCYALWGKKAEAEEILDQLKKERRPGYVSYAVAEIYEALGRKEEALGWLEKAYEERAPQMIGLKSNFDTLSSDSRFQDLQRRVGVPNS